MRLTILNQFFYPDHSATSQLMTDLAENLCEHGFEVTAVAARGRYNGGDTLPASEVHNGVRIERAWATGFGKKRLWGRLADYVTFYLSACWKLLTMPRQDVVMALTTPVAVRCASSASDTEPRSALAVTVCSANPESCPSLAVSRMTYVPAALKLAGLSQDALDWIELNEAFAAQSLAVIDTLKLDPAKVNPMGGAIALGHPLGATGAIRAATVVHALHRHNLKYGMVTMCVGMGQGAAGIIERV